MRVIAGEYRSRKLKTVAGTLVRPTPDRLREALFSVLTPRLAGKVFVDAYAGSGAVGIEALSRGASRVVLIEKNADALAVIKENLATLGVKEGVVVARGPAVRLLPQYPCDIAFVDPPYGLRKEYDEAIGALAEMACPLVIAQHESKYELADRYGALERVRTLRQGDNTLTFYEPLVSR
jgi:16S rRNA (guanine(966)-N(2))-methyltransferase RsmD